MTDICKKMQALNAAFGPSGDETEIGNVIKELAAPFVDEIAEEREDIKVCKVNVDEENALAAAFGISSIPTLIFFKDGKAEKAVVGYRTKEDLLSEIGGPFA